jgi:hypothetical protein
MKSVIRSSPGNITVVRRLTDTRFRMSRLRPDQEKAFDRQMLVASLLLVFLHLIKSKSSSKWKVEQ